MSSWATRCNACGTSFRVSEDQLKISDGYVRCGRCDAVFNARSTLFDLDAPVSAPAPLAEAPTATVAPSQPFEPAFAPAASEIDAQADDSVFPPTAVPDEPPPSQDESATEPSWDEALQAVPDRAEPSWSEAPTSDLQAAPAEDATARMRELLGAEATPLGEFSPASPAPASESLHVWPSLSRGPVRASAPTGPRQRRWTALGLVLAALLAFALPLQWAWIEREALRAQVPELDGLLQKHWPTLQSSGWRRLDGLSVASSSLQATPQGRAYQLELLLHNRAPHRIALPWLDLSLSDAGGKLLLRRAISPAELGNDKQMQAGEQRRLSMVFRVDADQPIAGYELGLFHP
jgi:predicted Zn finger-like uncharacterized protein